MPKKVSAVAKGDNLLSLIHSLNGNEKRYFNLFSALQSGDKSYMQLFDLMQQNMVYSPKVMSEAMGISMKQLADTKNYLQHVLLTALGNFDNDKTKVTAILREYQKARAAYERGLFEFAFKLTKGAIKKAKQGEVYFFMPSLLVLKQGCLTKLNKIRLLVGLLKEFDEASMASSEIFHLSQLAYLVSYYSTGEKDAAKVKEIARHPLLVTNYKRLHSIKAKIAWFMAKAIIHSKLSDEAISLKISKEAVRFYEATPNALKINATNYYMTIVNIAIGETHFGQFSSALKNVDKVLLMLKENRKNLSTTQKAKSLDMAEQTKAIIFLRMGMAEDALKILEKFYPKRKTFIPSTKVSIVYFTGLALFLLRRGKESLTYLNEIGHYKNEGRDDNLLHAHLLIILIHLELRNYTLLPSLIRAYQNRTKTTATKVKGAAEMLRAIMKICKSPVSGRDKTEKSFCDLMISEQLSELGSEFHLKQWVKDFAQLRAWDKRRI